MTPISSNSSQVCLRTQLPRLLMCWVVGVASLVSAANIAYSAVPREGMTGIFLPSDRLDSRGIERAKQLIAKGEFSQAIRFLDEVLARDEDSFVAGRDDEVYGLKGTARQILKLLPPEGQRIYQTTFGPVSRRLLKQSVSNGDLRQLRQIAQRYFYTPAGHEAALLFAQHEADQGRHLTAALTYQQLLETTEAANRFEPQLSVLAATSWLAADNLSRAADVMRRLIEQGYRSVQLSGEDVPLRVSEYGLVDWLEQSVGAPVVRDQNGEPEWLTVRGNPSRNGHVDGGLPHLRVRWQVRLLEHHDLEEVHEKMAGLLKRQDKSRLPAATPLAVGDYVITRSAHGLIAIDFQTGKRVWQAQPQRASLLQALVDANSRRDEDNSDIEPAQSFARMIWEDYLYNTTSSDGQRVFVIRDLAPPRFDRRASPPFMPRPADDSRNDDTNRLCAYDLPTQGKLVWEVDGAARSDELRGAFFLGAPVTVGQSLYCLVEIKSDTAIYLVALDRKTGALRWRQQLADLERGVSLDVKRRMQASMPSYDEGMLICPTGAGVVVGVDLAKQALAWAYRYQPATRPNSRQRILEGRIMTVASKQWVHSALLIADGRVLLTPPESNELHCLDLLTGKLHWKCSRGDALFLAGVDEGRVLLVGGRNMSALRLDDGTPLWPTQKLELPFGSTPSGSGFFSKGKYFLPLASAQVVAVDVATGKIVETANSRDGQLLGNLICYRGAVISQSGRYLDCFEQVDVLRAESERRRAADPNDFESLRTLGEIAYNDGKLAQAIELLSEAYESEPDDLRTREVLGEALVAALDEEFAKYQELLPLLAEIQEDSVEAQLTLMRLHAQGLQELGLSDVAFEVCLSAYEKLAFAPTDLVIGRDHQVDARRWLAAQSAAAWESASHDQRERIAELLSPLLLETLQVADTSHWQQFYDSFGALELAETLGLALATEHIQQGEVLAGQQLLLKLSESENDAVRNAAIAQNSRLLHEADLPFLATVFDRQLGGALANVECFNGMTGSDCLADWASASEASVRQWPYGEVESSVEDTKVTGTTRSSRNPQTGIKLERCDEILGSCNVSHLGMVSGRNRAIAIRDSLGRDFYQAKLDQGSRTILNAQGSVYGVSRGNLLVLSLGRQIVAFDTLSHGSKPLWRKNTVSTLQYVNQRRSGLRGQIGGPHASRSHINGNWLGLIGPVTHNSCLFQIEQRLVCLDTLTGEEKWSRDNLPVGCDLFGDEKVVFAIPKESKQALVFSAVDGRSLGETAHDLPAWQERRATVGRQIIRWRRLADRRWELSSIDALLGAVTWKHEFEKNARVDFAQNRFAAVAEPTGGCAIVDITDGRLVVDQPIEVNVVMNEVHLLVGTDRFVLAVQQPFEGSRKRFVKGLYGREDFTPTGFSGQLYMFDRSSGTALWNRPAEVEGLPLMLSQAVDLPVIVFAGNIRRQDTQGSRSEVGITLLEKSSGRVLFHRETLPQSPHQFVIRASDSHRNETTVELSSRRITLKFTDRPRAPEPPAMQDVQRNRELRFTRIAKNR